MRSGARDAVAKNALSMKLCGKYIAPFIISNKCRMITMFIYVVLMMVACLSAANIEVYFDQSYFITKDSDIRPWFEANQEYFEKSSPPTDTYVESVRYTDESVDFSSEES